MTKSTATHGGRREGRAIRFGLGLVRRVYAVGVIAVTAWLSYMAIRYLVVTLMFPTTAPQQIVGIPTRMTRDVLQTGRGEWAGVGASENPREPLAHYHRSQGWIQPDRFNDCAQSGCHAPLPHSKRKEVRAFLNMHATSLQCGVCHMNPGATPLVLTWYDLRTGETCDAPPALQAYGFVMSEEGRRSLANGDTAAQTRLADLLAKAAEGADGVATLSELSRHVGAVRSTSDEFQKLVESIRTVLPRHFRGEYGAKLALRDAKTGGPMLAYPGTAEDVREWLARGSSLLPAPRAALLERIHPAGRSRTLHCTECHRQTGSLIDFTKLGYPPARQEMLIKPPVFKMIEHISAGQPMNLPTFLAGPQTTQESAPTTQPQ